MDEDKPMIGELAPASQTGRRAAIPAVRPRSPR